MIDINDNLRIKNTTKLLPANTLLEKYPINKNIISMIQKSRKLIHQILVGKDDRLIVIIGPCSIHDINATLEYAQRLKKIHDILKDDLEIIMRVYCEKPRTTIGWKGLINDPFIDNTYDINSGLCMARYLLFTINDLGLPTASEFLDVITPPYITDLTSWGAIGARTTESQVHRELASGFPFPIGFKNSTNGTIKIAIDAINTAKVGHSFLSVNKWGNAAIIHTIGNDDCHIILRGGKTPNYSISDIQLVKTILIKSKLLVNIMIDFSHANCNKEYKKQIEVSYNVINQIKYNEKSIIGVMIESHLNEGRQDVNENKILNYGQSITDACLGWKDSEKILYNLASAVQIRRKKNS